MNTSSITRLPGFLLLVAFVCLALNPPPARSRQASPSGIGDAGVQRSITVTFNYDFSKNPPCDEQPKEKNCVKQFVVYDDSVRKAQLFTIPVPKGANGLVRGITGQSPRRAFLPGRHRIAVTAENAAGEESAVTAASFVVDIQPGSDSPASPAH